MAVFRVEKTKDYMVMANHHLKNKRLSLKAKGLLSLNSLHIEYVFECMENNPSDIRNIKKYLLTTLFNAPATMSSYYDAKVRHDLSKPRYDWADLIDG